MYFLSKAILNLIKFKNVRALCALVYELLACLKAADPKIRGTARAMPTYVGGCGQSHVYRR